MTRIDDQLRMAAQRLRHDIERTTDVEAALLHTPAPRTSVTSSRVARRPLLTAVAALVAIVGIATIALAARPEADRTVIADSTTSTETGTPSTTDATTPVAVDPSLLGPDLLAPEPGREITFDAVGDVRLDQPLAPSEVSRFEDFGSCGYWGPNEPSHDGDEPLNGIVAGADTPTPRVLTIMVRGNTTYRTASGVGVGTRLTTLQRLYGDDLVVDRLDVEGAPTRGLRASYNDVAAVRDGDHALTFYLRDDTVEAVKVSHADFWGDDEGCA